MDKTSVIIALLTSVPLSTIVVKFMDNHYTKEKEKVDATEKAREELMKKFESDLAETKDEIRVLKQENKELNLKLDEVIQQKIRAEYDRDYYKALLEGSEFHAKTE